VQESGAVTSLADDLERRAAALSVGADKERVRQVLGEPLNTSHLSDGGETWLYLKADPERKQMESLSAEFGAAGDFKGLRRKPLD
jgi:outer membrane protein assembly factor BamE (lipoprotein component of BamABCDE complex)